jgi:hypothetical protein
MKRLSGLSSLAWLFLTIMAGIGLIWGALQIGLGDLINPSPEQVAEQLVRGIGSHRYEGAIQMLNRPLQASVSPFMFRRLAASIEQASGGIEAVTGLSSRERGSTAEAQVLVTLKDGAEVTLVFYLENENGEWKVADLAPIWQLIHATQTLRLLDL